MTTAAVPSRTSRTTGSSTQSLASEDGLYAVDAEQRIRFWSESAADLLGVTADEAIGRPCYDVMGGADRSNARHCRVDCPVIANARRGRGTPDFDIAVSTQSGERRIVNVSVLILRNTEPIDPTTIHLFRDVTQVRHVDAVAHSVSKRLTQRGAPPEACLLEPLTPRQLQTLQLLAAGLGPRDIAHALGISPTTVRNHLSGAMTRLGAHTRLEALSSAVQAGLI